MAVIKLVPQQIPVFWEAIKAATTRADEVDAKDYPVYLNKMLHDLLNDKNQCFVRLTAERVLASILVTQLDDDLLSGKKLLRIKTLYSWQPVAPTEWQEDFKFLRDFAAREKCSRILFDSRNARVQELGASLGFKEVTRSFVLEI